MTCNDPAPQREARLAHNEAGPNTSKEEEVLKFRGLLTQMLILGVPIVIELIWNWSTNKKKAT